MRTFRESVQIFDIIYLSLSVRYSVPQRGRGRDVRENKKGRREGALGEVPGNARQPVKPNFQLLSKYII